MFYQMLFSILILFFNPVLLINLLQTPSTNSLLLIFHYPPILPSQHNPFPSAVFLYLTLVSSLSIHLFSQPSSVFFLELLH